MENEKYTELLSHIAEIHMALDKHSGQLDALNNSVNVIINSSNETNSILKEILKINVEQLEKTSGVIEKLSDDNTDTQRKLSRVDGLEKHYEDLEERVKRLENLNKAS